MACRKMPLFDASYLFGSSQLLGIPHDYGNLHKTDEIS